MLKEPETDTPPWLLYKNIQEGFHALTQEERYLFVRNLAAETILIHAQRISSGHTALIVGFHMLAGNFAQEISELTGLLIDSIDSTETGCGQCPRCLERKAKAEEAEQGKQQGQPPEQQPSSKGPDVVKTSAAYWK